MKYKGKSVHVQRIRGKKAPRIQEISSKKADEAKQKAEETLKAQITQNEQNR